MRIGACSGLCVAVPEVDADGVTEIAGLRAALSVSEADVLVQQESSGTHSPCYRLKVKDTCLPRPKSGRGRGLPRTREPFMTKGFEAREFHDVCTLGACRN